MSEIPSHIREKAGDVMLTLDGQGFLDARSDYYGVERIIAAAIWAEVQPLVEALQWHVGCRDVDCMKDNLTTEKLQRTWEVLQPYIAEPQAESR